MSLEAELLAIMDEMKNGRRRIVSNLRFEPGLTDQEVGDIESRCHFCFPPDLKLFLQLGIPLGSSNRSSIEQFPNWRDNPEKIMQDTKADWEDTVCFDIENNNYWMTTEWGQKPQKLSEQLAIAKEYLQGIPVMIPIYAHRRMPVEPCEAGNPVFSVWQAIDTIHYGYNLTSYLRNEFLPWNDDWGEASDYKTIRYWSKITEDGHWHTPEK
ncbi:MAG: hypothetical protein IT321_04490 [Anaerolineae bacterium]|nr:hypothetical protein [Anaerolineae bacterium]